MGKWTINPATITSEVKGEEVLFKSIPLGTIFKIKELEKKNKAVSKLLANFFINKGSRTFERMVHQEVVDKEKELVNVSTKESPTDPQIYSKQLMEMEKGMVGIIDSLLSSEMEHLIAEVIYKSVHDKSYFEDFSQEDLQHQIEEGDMDIADIGEFLFGAFRASSGVLKRLGKQSRLIATVVQFIEEILQPPEEDQG